MSRRVQTAVLLALWPFAGTAMGAVDPAAGTTPAAPALALPDAGPVAVRWNDPATFTELRTGAGRRDNTNRGDWVRQLAEHLRASAQPRLAEGERLEVVITDIKRAGDFEPWHDPRYQDVRIVRDIYPPRISLSWRRLDADGRVLDQGERRIVDGGFLVDGTSVNASDPLRHEKRLIDRWVRTQFAHSGA